VNPTLLSESPTCPASLYFPGFSALPLIRPEKVKLFGPLAPWWVKLLFTGL
jgi:hypothetical protein